MIALTIGVSIVDVQGMGSKSRKAEWCLSSLDGNKLSALLSSKISKRSMGYAGRLLS